MPLNLPRRWPSWRYRSLTNERGKRPIDYSSERSGANEGADEGRVTRRGVPLNSAIMKLTDVYD